MKITFISLFPKYFKPLVEESIIKRAIRKEIVEIEAKDLRDYSLDSKHHQIDDKVYGGGKGMLIQVEPVHRAIKDNPGHVILLTPQGQKFTQQKAEALTKYDRITFIAGRYEGFDERIRHYVDEEISIGDYVLTGGELPAMVIADAVIRLLPDVIKVESHQQDSFQNGLLDFPQYTRPRVYDGHEVPAVIVEGHHAKIDAWRKQQQERRTKQRRPDLLKSKPKKGEKNAK